MKSISALSTEKRKKKYLSPSTCDQSAVSHSPSANHIRFCVALAYLAFLFVPSAVNLCCHFTSLHLIWSSFCVLSWCSDCTHSLPLPLSPGPVFKYLKKCREDSLTSNKSFHFFILLLLSCEAGRALLFWKKAFSIFLSFRLAQGAFDDRGLFCPCLHVIV